MSAPVEKPSTAGDTGGRNEALGLRCEEDDVFLSTLTFQWVTPMLRKGRQAVSDMLPFTTQDMVGLPSFMAPAKNYQRFLEEWKLEQERVAALPPPEPGKPKPVPSLSRALRLTIGKHAYIGAVFRFLSDAANVGMPFILRWFLDWMIKYFFLNHDKSQMWRGFLIALFLCLDMYLVSCFNNFVMWFTVRSFVQARDIAVMAVYEKAMRLESNNRLAGKILTMHSTDCNKLIEMGIFVHAVWASPLLIIAALVALWFFIGPAGLLSLAVMIVLMPINGIAAGQMMKIRGLINGITDERMRSVRELLNGIRIIKFMNWEKEAQRKIKVARDKEVAAFGGFFLARSVLVGMITTLPVVVNFVVFAAAYGFGRKINATTVFPVLAMLNILRAPLAFLPMALGKLIDTNVSLGRIQEFLLTEEHKDYVEELNDQAAAEIPEAKGAAVVLQHADLQCLNENDRTQKTTLLHDVNLAIPEGKLTIVVGATGSGKSTLVNAIAGEGILGEGGRILRKGSIAFVAQEAWIMSSTVRGNIVLNREFDEAKYLKTVNACQLMADLEQLSGSDMTEIGERGINLSGGQKQRIAFARALYSDIPLVLMDDPLSAVDAHVRVALFDDVITGALDGRTRVLVTHYVEYLPRADYIVVVQEKKIAFAGTYDQLQAEGNVDLASIVDQGQTPSARSPKGGSLTPASAQSPAEPKPMTHRESIPAPHTGVEGGGTKLISEEHQVVGSVPNRVVGWYIKNQGLFTFFLVVLGFLSWRTASVISDELLSFWSRRTPIDGHVLTEKQYLMWFGIWIGISTVFVALRQVPFVVGCLRAARISHDQMVLSIVRAPMSFFDTTPVGRIINRFSKDMEGQDLIIPENLNFFYQMIFVFLGAMAVVIYGAPYMAIILAVMSVIFIVLLRYYTATNRALKRLDGITRSPVMAIMSESLGGLTTLRAYDIVQSFSDRHTYNLTRNSRTVNASMAARSWLSFRIDGICFFINLGVTYLVIGLLESYDVQGRVDNFAAMSLAITTSVLVGGALSFMATMSADLEAAMSSVERVEEYVNGIPQERDITYSDAADGSDPNTVKPLPTGWPRTGTIEVRNASLRYREGLPLVLKNVTVTFKDGEKVGIVGRTGSGKSTIMLALFRMIELAEGSIVIDGADIASVDLSTLRSSITIIPQDPLLFEGTIRSNLDPFDQHSTEEVTEALRTVGMLSVIEDKVRGNLAKAQPEGTHTNQPVSDEGHALKPLDCVVDERGSNFSVGQRQLLCLARAIMKKSRILLLDEATASVDFESDELIQHTVRNEFKHCTVLTIAHRLQTVMDSDKILALDGGEVREFDHPRNLLANPNGHFYSMVSGLGQEQFDLLKAKTRTPPVRGTN